MIFLDVILFIWFLKNFLISIHWTSWISVLILLIRFGEKSIISSSFFKISTSHCFSGAPFTCIVGHLIMFHRWQRLCSFNFLQLFSLWDFVGMFSIAVSLSSLTFSFAVSTLLVLSQLFNLHPAPGLCLCSSISMKCSFLTLTLTLTLILTTWLSPYPPPDLQLIVLL